MRLRLLITIAAGTVLLTPGISRADFAHLVAPGETLTSIAAADGLSVAQVAAANGLSLDSQLISGSTVMIPPQSGGSIGGIVASATPTTTPAATPTASGGDGDADGDDPGVAAAPSSSAPSAGSYVVQPGDTLSAIAARAGTSADQLAALNGLNVNDLLVSGSVLQLSGTGSSSSAAAPSNSSSTTGGSYIVQPGDTLSAIAARAGTSVDQLAALNGLSAGGVLLSGSVLRLGGSSGTFVSTSTGASGNAATSQPVGTVAQGSPSDPPYPTPERVSASQIGQIAAANGVPPSLAEAIGWQESGFNNDLVSSSDARGVMQILPGTWNWIGQTMAGTMPLAPASALSNVRAGVLLLHSLLNSTGGNQAEAAAGYYQGLPSVQQKGMYSDTQQYVNNVLSLEHQFGGG